MKRIRGGMGIGDSLYMQPIVRHLVAQGEQLEVCSKWDDIFRYLPVKMAPHSRQNIQYLSHYTRGKYKAGTTQFQDCCKSAGVPLDIEFKLDWQLVNPTWRERLNVGKPVVVVQLPRAPMGRTDGFGMELLPDCRVIQKAIDQLRDHAYIVQVGAGEALYEFEGIDLDLANHTSVSDLIDVAYLADAFVGYCSFMVPLAESFDKPALFVWSNRGLLSSHQFITSITPQKILHKKTSTFVIDNTGSLDACQILK